MHILKYIIKLFIAYSLFYSGILNLYRHLFFKGRAIVLMYHRVLPANKHINCFSHDGIIVHDDTFRKQIEFLSQHFDIININDFSAYLLNNTPLNSAACLITFDDGWSDNYNYAFPILKENRSAAHIFLPINYISNTDNFWQEKLGHFIHHLCNHADTFSKLLTKHKITHIAEATLTARKSLIREYVSSLKRLPPDEIKALINEFDRHMSDKSCPPPLNTIDTYMSWDQINEMSRDLITFGSHAMSHHILTKLSVTELEHELVTSKAVIESRINQSINSIAYPNGNHDKIVCDITRNTSYKMGFTTEPGFVTTSTNPYCIPRINIHEDMTKHMPLFYCRILGIF